jgi:hypothetical protein
MTDSMARFAGDTQTKKKYKILESSPDKSQTKKFNPVDFFYFYFSF